MKIVKLVPLLLLLTLLPDLAFSADFGRARIGFVAGDVQIQTVDIPEWLPASINTPVREGDRLWVPEGGRTEVQVVGGVSIRLDSFSSLDTLTLGGEAIQFALNSGRAYINNGRHGIDTIQIDTPLSSVACRDDSLTMVDVGDSGTTEISVFRGEAYAETRNGSTRVPEGATLLIREDLTAELYPLAAGDEWEEWNRERNSMLAGAGESARYLPSELNDYVSDFDNNGRWFNTPDYGYVWSPAVSFSVNWAPYRIGRWAWLGGHYIWISYEAWGWAPYHYGRWAFLGGRGWCWIPPRHGAAHWAPGYVGWVHTPTYVSWVPLAPGDTYYGHGYYGPGSVNINTININTIIAHRNFRNIDARNAVTVLHRDTFFHGRRSDFRLRENPFRQHNTGFGPPPAVRAERTTVSPVIRTIPVAKLPPPAVQRIRPDTIRRERRLVTDQRSSVFRQGNPVRQMPTIRGEDPRRPGQHQTGTRPAEAGRVQTEKEKPPMVTPMPSRRPAAVRPTDGRTDGLRLPATPSRTGTAPPVTVKPPMESTPRAPLSPTTAAPPVATPGTPPSVTGTRPPGQPMERTRVRTAPGETLTGRQPTAVTGTPTQGRSRTSVPQGIRVAPRPAAQQPVVPKPILTPQQPTKPETPASAVQQPARIPLPQVQRPATVPRQGQQRPTQPGTIQRTPTPQTQGSPRAQQVKPSLPPVQQPTVQQQPEKPAPARQESGTREKTSSKPTSLQPNTGTVQNPPSYPPHGQGIRGAR